LNDETFLRISTEFYLKEKNSFGRRAYLCGSSIKRWEGDKYQLAQNVIRVRAFVNTEILVTRKLASK